MKAFITKFKHLFSPSQTVAKKQQPLSELELEKQAEKFAEKYGEVLKKLARE